MATGSTLARRALGRQLHKLRERAKVKQAEAARLIGVSPQTIGRLEDGETTRPNDVFLNILCDAYRVTNKERKMVLGLSRDVRKAAKQGGGWWRGFADEFPADFDHYLALEDAANRLTVWRTTILPGLLQIPEYRRAIAWSEIPQLSAETIDQRVELVVRRQAKLEDPEFHLDALLWEAVLRDRVGGAAVMAEQARHLAKLSERQNVSIRIVPFDARQRLGVMVGACSLLEFPPLPQSKAAVSPIVYVEEYVGDLYFEREEEEVRPYRDALREISRVALGTAESRQKILEIAEEHQREC
ncbi:helix-turn-helix domain-containing protein [Nocardia terpenica]|uniref:helix-turn-helix domain-containing protein n=1 Tax=Nocardia terpenica TaxID=455432 RepID=UPI0009ECCDC1|nr:helix-turn-helix transcriptional regulator [Nocardia terpenica]